MILQITDVNYGYDEKKNTVINIFGKTRKGESVIKKVIGFKPYFYVGIYKNESSEYVKQELEKMGLVVEKIKKFEPIGYQESQKTMFKATTIDPKEVKNLRDKAKMINGVKDVYETDILFKNRFLIDKNIGGMSWIKVPDKQEINEKDIEKLELDENAPLKIMTFDIECLPEEGQMPMAEKSPVILISMAFSPNYDKHESLVLVGKPIKCNNDDTITCASESGMINDFLSILKDYNPDIIAGYNSNAFDFNYTETRAEMLGIKTPWYIKKIVTNTNVSMSGKIIIDLLPILRSSTEDKYKLKQYTLRNVAKELLKIEKLDIEPKEIENLWKGEGEGLKKFIKYSRRDAVLVMHLLKEMKLVERYTEMAKASGSLLQDIANGGQSGMIENLLLRRFRKYNRVVSPKPNSEMSDDRLEENQNLKGGEVLTPKKGVIEDTVILDYKSLYPTIMMAHNICYSTVIVNTLKSDDGLIIAPEGGGRFVKSSVLPGIVPEILNELLDKRIKIKKAMKNTTDENEKNFLDAKQYALKILLNSFYGYSGYTRARLYDLRIANAVTSFGRENIIKTKGVIDKIEEEELEVVYGDTDSVFVKIKHAEEKQLSTQEAETIGKMIAEKVTMNLPKPMELVFESFAKRGILLAKKRYALWILDSNGKDKIKVRGIETVRRDWCNMTSKIIAQCLDLILKEGKIDETIKLVDKTIKKIQKSNVNMNQEILDDLVITKRYTKGATSYKNKQAHIQLIERMKNRGGTQPSIGDRIPYVIVKGRMRGKKQKDKFVDRAEDPEYVMKNNLQIDTDYYINKQILPPVLRILECTGKDVSLLKNEVMRDGKQKTLGEW